MTDSHAAPFWPEDKDLRDVPWKRLRKPEEVRKIHEWASGLGDDLETVSNVYKDLIALLEELCNAYVRLTMRLEDFSPHEKDRIEDVVGPLLDYCFEWHQGDTPPTQVWPHFSCNICGEEGPRRHLIEHTKNCVVGNFMTVYYDIVIRRGQP